MSLLIQMTFYTVHAQVFLYIFLLKYDYLFDRFFNDWYHIFSEAIKKAQIFFKSISLSDVFYMQFQSNLL